MEYVEDFFNQASAWVISEGWIRMIEHIFVVVMVIKLLPMLKIQSRGKTGFINSIKKLGIRLSRKIGFVDRNIQSKLAGEASEGVAKMLESKTIKGKYG